MKSKKQKPQLEYADRALVMHREANAAEFKEAAKLIAEAKSSCKKLGKQTVAATNKCRAAGIMIKTLCGHDHVSIEFWQKNDCSKKLGVGFETAKWLVSIANKLENPVRTLMEAAPYLLQCFFATELLESPKREDQQQAIHFDLVQIFFKKITTDKQDFEKAIRAQPMETWKPVLLDSLLSETEWISVIRDRAMKLRGDEYRKG